MASAVATASKPGKKARAAFCRVINLTEVARHLSLVFATVAIATKELND